VNTFLTVLGLCSVMSLAFFLLAGRVGPQAETKKVVELGSPVVALAQTANTVYAASASGTVWAIDDSARAPVQAKIDLGHRILAIAVFQSFVYVLGERSVTRLSLSLTAPRETRLQARDAGLIGAGYGGIWVASRTHGVVEQLAPESLRPRHRTELRERIEEMLVTSRGIWLTTSGPPNLIRLTAAPQHRLSTATVQSLPSDATALASLEGKILVLLQQSHHVIAFDEASGQPTGYSLRVDPGVSTMTRGNSALWTASPRDEAVSQFGLRQHHRLGNPNDVDGRPVALIVDLVAVWVAVADEDGVVRLDLQGLHLEHLSSLGAWNTPLEVPGPDWLLASFALALMWLVCHRAWTGSDPDRGARYEFRPFKLLAHSPDWTSYGDGTTRVSRRARRFGVSLRPHPVEVGGDGEVEEELDMPKEADVKRGLRTLHKRDLIRFGVSSMPRTGRWLRRELSAHARTSRALRRLSELTENQLVMLVGRWLVTRPSPGLLRLQLTTLIERVNGEDRYVEVDEAAWVTVEFPVTMLVNQRELVPGETKLLDVLAEVPARGPHGDPRDLRMLLVLQRLSPKASTTPAERAARPDRVRSRRRMRGLLGRRQASRR
jgi:hypothetical protein